MTEKELWKLLRLVFGESDAWIRGWLTNGDPRTDIAQAWMLVERITEQGYSFDLGTPYRNKSDWWAQFTSDNFAYADTAPLAICLAALKMYKINYELRCVPDPLTQNEEEWVNSKLTFIATGSKKSIERIRTIIKNAIPCPICGGRGWYASRDDTWVGDRRCLSCNALHMKE